ncbi:DUF6095 family protein [Tenacibaculum agarivorans]|uniref:DUF6095 family protein n=1 Tax=Tenacibaculum agarivorans TaxID=1908389 RepID=UPI000B25A2F6|nr:DUF6095 family protein [Tenacibaculum agarivorans]
MDNNTSAEKTIKKFLILLLLLMTSPIVLSLGFRAQRTFTKMPEIIISYIVLIIGLFLTSFTVYFGFKTFKSLLNTLFDKKI